jgi:3-oxoacyl-[acyl-carrier protein] reductase
LFEHENAVIYGAAGSIGSTVACAFAREGARVFLAGRDRRYHLTGSFSTACAAIEALTRSLAGDLGSQGVRVVCLRPDAIPQTWWLEQRDDPSGCGVRAYLENSIALGRLPTLEEVANAAAFMASDRASVITGTVVNLTCGSIMD